MAPDPIRDGTVYAPKVRPNRSSSAVSARPRISPAGVSRNCPAAASPASSASTCARNSSSPPHASATYAARASESSDFAASKMALTLAHRSAVRFMPEQFYNAVQCHQLSAISYQLPAMTHVVVRVARNAGIVALFIIAAMLGILSGVMFAFAGDLPAVSALDNYNP